MSDNANYSNVETPKKKKSFLIVVFAIVLALAAASFFTYAYFTKSFLFKEDSEASQLSEAVYPLDEFVLNLKDPSSRRYLKTQIAIGYGNEKDEELIKEKQFQIRDIIIQTLRSKTAEEIMAVEKTDELKLELMRNINELYEPDLVLEVFIVDFLIQ